MKLGFENFRFYADVEDGKWLTRVGKVDNETPDAFVIDVFSRIKYFGWKYGIKIQNSPEEHP